MSEPRSAPTVLQMVLGRRLQELRLAAGLTAQEAGKRLRIAHTTVTRMEQAKVTLKWASVKALLEIYGLAPAEVEQFLVLADQANAPGWWQNFRDVLPAWFGAYVSLESSACRIRGYEPGVVPGLLQTRDYARSVLRLNRPRPTLDELERRVELRMERQTLLTRENPPHLWVVMEETVLRRQAGPAPDVMRNQLDRLLEVSYLPNVTLQVLPFAAGLHPGAFGPFTLFRFSMEDFPDIVCTDALSRAAYSEDRDEVALYRETLDRMCAQALPKKSTRQLLADTRKELYS
ncbi:helix-turn-helix domain-containing protein [Streptomyces tauricus]|uniref:helix-turn-helix domain-containing protein n=1 Tax=Streptomyces tauricus TaxID=68274 RepID=UPI002244CFB4|nr:helix-turn-helix transcriptional regulator [Streptomyces tauricus]MCW8101715.1 helix-turn-helix domain-containing protein [Streptomyces tauricus]